MKKLVLLVLLSTIAHPRTAPIVEQIDFIGNEITKDYVIEREIQHPIHAPLDSAIARADHDRLLNLGIFNDVRWLTIPLSDSTVVLRYLVMESIRYIPALMPFNDEYGWSLGFAIMINNFRGRNASLMFRGKTGGVDALNVTYFNPWVAGDHISIYTSTGTDIYNHPFQDRRVKAEFFQFFLGRYFGYKRKLQGGLQVFNQTYRKEDSVARFRYWGPVLSGTLDTRDIYSNPSRGMLLTWFLEGNYRLAEASINYVRISQSYSFYKSLTTGPKPWIGTLNGQLILKPGTVPELMTDYLGGAYSVRGWNYPTAADYANQPWRFGHHSWRVSGELRRALIPRTSPAPGVEFGLDLGIFVDAGVITRKAADLVLQEPMFGTGIGLRIPLAGYEPIRIDYAVGYYDGNRTKGTLHLAVGQKF